jgi:hypothetical protein
MSKARSLTLVLMCALVVLPTDGEGAQNKREKWYTYWGLGGADPTYPSEVGSLLDLMGALPGVDRTRMSMDLLGFYVPMSSKILAGVVVNASADRLDYGDEDWMQVNLYTYAASAQYYARQVGQGLFGRLDIGLAAANVSYDIEGDTEDETSDSGIGMLVGIGYAYPILSGTRIAFNLNYAMRTIEEEAYSTVGFSVGGLF